MREPFKIFYSIFQEKTKLKEYADSGRKVFGTMCNNVPEEIIHSFNAVPVRMFGNYGNTNLANSKIPSWTCNYARNVMEAGLRGDFDFLSGIVSATTDDTKIHLFSAYRFYMKPEFSYLVQFPYVRDDISKEFFAKELERFSEHVSSFLSVEFDEERLSESIGIYNRYRDLCMKFESLRAEEKPKIRADEFMALMLASLSMLKEDFISMAENLPEMLKEHDGFSDYRLRIHLSGTDFYNLTLLRLIEESGMAVVSDDLCTSAGYFTGKVEGDGFEGIAERYSRCTACVMTSSNTELSVEERLRFIRKKIKENKADAIVLLKDRGCEVCGHQCPWIVRETDTPVLVLDLDFPLSVEQYRTRMEAFVEAHGGG